MKLDQATLDKMPQHVRERLEAIETTTAAQIASGTPAAPVTDVAPTIISTKYVPTASAPVVAAAAPAAPEPAKLPEKVATVEDLGSIFGSPMGEAHEPVPAKVSTPVVDPEVQKLRDEVERLTAAQAKGGFKFGDDSRSKYVALLGEEGTAMLESDMARLAPKEQRDVLTHKDLEKREAKAAESKFFADLPKDFYRHASSADTEFLKWASATKDGRRTVKDEIGEIVKMRDASGLAYIAEKLNAWQASRKAPAPGTHVGAPAPAGSTPTDKATATAEDQAAVRAAIRRGDLKGAGEKLSQFQ